MCVVDIDRTKHSISLCLNSEVNGEEKIAIKSALISSFSEPVPQIAVQIAELIARIARYAYPSMQSFKQKFFFGLKFTKFGFLELLSI